MRITTTPLAGPRLVDLEPFTDERGWFARALSLQEFEQAGVTFEVVQANLSYNVHEGTLRGLHWQDPPHGEAKYLRCMRGAIYDLIVDVRPDSPTRHQWFGVELSASNGRGLYVPGGFAHGFVTLENDTLVHYDVDAAYAPGSERGLRFDDPAIGIEWPVEVSTISDKDATWPLLDGDTAP